MRQKQQVHVTMSNDTKERLLQIGFENHVPGGLSGVIQFLAWNFKVSNAQMRGQMNLEDLGKPSRNDKFRQEKQL